VPPWQHSSTGTSPSAAEKVALHCQVTLNWHRHKFTYIHARAHSDVGGALETHFLFSDTHRFGKHVQESLPSHLHLSESENGESTSGTATVLAGGMPRGQDSTQYNSSRWFQSQARVRDLQWFACCIIIKGRIHWPAFSKICGNVCKWLQFVLVWHYLIQNWLHPTTSSNIRSRFYSTDATSLLKLALDTGIRTFREPAL